MIFIEISDGIIVKVKVIGDLEDRDRVGLGTQVNRLLRSHTKLNYLIDATGFNGWPDMETAKNDFAFVREREKNIGRVAVIAGAAWHDWIASAVSVFSTLDIKVFRRGKLIEAANWLRQKHG